MTDTPWTGRTRTVENETLRDEAHIVREQARAVAGRRCLDVGCGPGMLADYNPDTIGVDFEDEWGPDVLGDARALPFADNSVPVVTTKTTLQHIPEWEAALDEMIRVASREVVCFERTHDEDGRGTYIHAHEPVLRRRFDMADFFGALSTADAVTTTSAGWCNADDRIGVYRGRIS